MKYWYVSDNQVDEEKKKAAFISLQMAKQELGLPEIKIRWFINEELKRAGLFSVQEEKYFERDNAILGLYDPTIPNEIQVNLWQGGEKAIQNTVFHEMFHAAQTHKHSITADRETYAYGYADDAVKRLSALTDKEKEALFFDYLSRI